MTRASPANGEARSSASILAVDDSPTQLQELHYLLEEAGFRVLTARDGREALHEARALKPDLVITDVVVPGMDGFALCKALRADGTLGQVPVILLTTLAAPEDVIRGLECGANGFITKPCDDEFLVAQVRSALASRELRNAAASDRRRGISYCGQAYAIDVDPRQMLELLLSTYTNAVHQNAALVRAREELRALNERLEEKVRARTAELDAEVAMRQRLYEELKATTEKIKTLSGLVPICMHCKRIRDDQGYWNVLEAFIGDHTNAEFTHGLCDDCQKKYYPEHPEDGESPEP